MSFGFKAIISHFKRDFKTFLEFIFFVLQCFYFSKNVVRNLARIEGKVSMNWMTIFFSIGIGIDVKYTNWN
jgi:hypothetical protein